MNTRRVIILSFVASAFSMSGAAFAGSATWKANPSTNDWKTAANWSPATIPNSETDIATFGSSNTTDVAAPNSIVLGGIVYNQGASPFTITFSGADAHFLYGDIVNNSGVTQNLINAVTVNDFTATIFLGNATIGDNIVITNQKEAAVNDSGGFTRFVQRSNAGAATIVNETNALTDFFENASAGNATIINQGGAVKGEAGAHTLFSSYRMVTPPPTAGNATIVNNGGTVPGAEGSFTSFTSKATAGNATLIANGGGANGGKGGSIRFYGQTTGGTARVEVFGNGNLDISAHVTHGVTIGSLEGDGFVFLGQNELTVGRNDLDTAFSGAVKDGGLGGGAGGSLTKIGNGKLTLSRANTYTGGTSVSNGLLLIDNGSGSGTGSGPVSVTGGGLGGNGIIAGAVAIGGSTNRGAFLSAGLTDLQPKTLTIQSGLTVNSTGTLKVNLASKLGKADEVIANGVIIKNGAEFNFVATGQVHFPSGTVFTVISNTSTTPISGRFTNLSDGVTFTSNGNSYRVSYEGGDGNDLTLTVQ